MSKIIFCNLMTYSNNNFSSGILLGLECNKYIISTRIRHRAESRDEMWWSPYIQGQWIAPTMAVAPSQGLKKWNGWDECVEKWWNEICGRGKQEKSREKLLGSHFSTTKSTWSDRDANLGPQRWESSVPWGRLEYTINPHNLIIITIAVFEKIEIFEFYFWATLGVKEVLHSLKNSTLIFLWFSIL